uniref:Uncharacterized protein n=1 Tax=Panagrolaimus superbus TaxID=310955 RepID=A0A914YYI1_9BILA
MIIKVKILQAVQAKFMENPVADNNLIRENVEVKPDNKLTGKTENACFESGRFSLKIPEILDSKKFDAEAKNETATEGENASRKSDKGKLGAEIGKEKYAEDNGKEIIRKFMDIREQTGSI